MRDPRDREIERLKAINETLVLALEEALHRMEFDNEYIGRKGSYALTRVREALRKAGSPRGGDPDLTIPQS